MLVNQNGRWLATILQASCGESSGQLPEWRAIYQITHSWDPSSKQWYDQVDDGQGGSVPWTNYDYQITGYHVLFSHDGKATKSYEQLQKIFGWNGNLMSLPQIQAEGVQVQIETRIETFNGQDRCKVVWIATADASPDRQLEPTDTGRWSQLASRFARPGGPAGRPVPARPAGGNGSKPPMRTNPVPPSRQPAMSTTPSDRDRAASTSGSPPARKAMTPAAPVAATATQYPPTADGAWQAFCDAYGDLDNQLRSEADRTEQWQRILEELFPGEAAADWGVMIEKAPEMILPF